MPANHVHVPDPDTVPGAGGIRSEPTRRTIIDAARVTFAARGYERTTIRAVAAQAKIDPSMVMRYFGSKAGLFAAASTIDLDVPDLRAAEPERRGELMVGHFVQRWEHGPGDDTLVFLMRTAVTNDAVAEQLQAKFNQLIAAPIEALGYADAPRRAALIGSQLLGLAVSRYLLRLQPVASLSPQEIVAGLGPAIQRVLDAVPGQTRPMA